MSKRIVLFGATGYTGRLTAKALVEQGAQPVLAGRDAGRLAAQASELGGLDTAVADVADPGTVAALLEQGDVMLTTVGPFARWGRPALEAAIAGRAAYIDSTGEPAFIRQVFEDYDAAARAAECGLVTACGWDWVPGNLAGGLALREAGDRASRVDVGYFATGGSPKGSGGTMASLAGAMLEPAFVYRGGRVATERTGRSVRSFRAAGSERQAISAGSSEHFGLPAIAPQLREVRAYLGWFGPASRAVQGMSAVTAGVTKIPGVKAGLGGIVKRAVKGSTGGPDAEARAEAGSHIVAIAYDAADAPLAEVHLDGVDGYTFTGGILAWAARRAADPGLKGTGALGPVGAFGLDELRDGVELAGIRVVDGA